jgi:D-glycero-D-manno-heptose 1,7-bisphosphate phosphatase
MIEERPYKLVVLDRDGVINEDSDDYIRSLDEWRPVPGSIEAIAALSRAGYRIAVATNQSGLARGYFDEYALARMHAYMNELVEEAGGSIDVVAWCPHGPAEGCDCRKPRPGLLDQIADTLGIPVSGAWLVGDTVKDIEVARARDCRPILVRSGKGRASEKTLHEAGDTAVPVFDDLRAAAEWILQQDAKED